MGAEPLANASSSRSLCRECRLFASCETPFMRPYVPQGWTRRRRLLVIGEAPGEHVRSRDGSVFNAYFHFPAAARNDIERYYASRDSLNAIAARYLDTTTEKEPTDHADAR